MTTDTTQNLEALRAHWIGLYHNPRHLLQHPSEVVIRWRHAHLAKPVNSKDRLLDIGCGGGRHTFYLANEGFSVSAIDIADSAINNILQRAADSDVGIHAQVAAADALDNFAAASFAGAVCYGVYTYMDEAAILRSLAQIHRLLKPGGTLLLVARARTDWRANYGTTLAPGRVHVDRLAGTPADSENGLTMTLPNRTQIEDWLSNFADCELNCETWTTGGGRYVNVDWHALAVG